jgi:hypothetical protein
MALELRRTAPLQGQIVGLDGQPTARAVILCPTYVPGDSSNYSGTVLHGANGRFGVPGYDRSRPVPVLFFDPDRLQGTRVELAGEEPTVRLLPCRSATVRFVDEEGKPAVGARIQLDVMVHPGGTPVHERWRFLHSGYAVPAAMLGDPRYATAGTQPGEIVFHALIPGATYLIEADEGNGMVVKKTFTVNANEDVTLPNIVVRQADERLKKKG